ncbi:hypothetical protein [Winslowiella toletana]|uniref:hypothetical protein n=1 Tax=Winslowiella toletana TaxID=92490 RepID=UPI0028BE58AE|nr:hypothetical protein [Winslowiella toletana]WNN42840.1 hypothetical protein RIN69_14070 [Winslowiella toletana]
MSDLENLKATAGLALFPIVCTEREARALLAKLATPDSIIELFDKLEAAEAQVKELTADLDKESEIRHRIHEELNAIKGEQQPIYQVEVLEGRVDYSKPEFDKMIVGDFPCTGKRVLFNHPAPEVLPVVELTDSTLAEVVRAWNRADYPASAYPAMREVLRAAGLEVKS